MMMSTTIWTFFTASVLLALAPGPDNIFVLTQSSLLGRRVGLAVTCGLCTGLIGHSMAVALGVAIVFQRSAAAFTVLKFIGASYLVYLAWQAFSAPAARMKPNRSNKGTLLTMYGRGIIMNLTNPKVSIFFLAFLPQFTDPSRGLMSLQILLLGGVFILATILVFGSISLLAGTLGPWFNRSARVQGIMNKVAGAVLLSLALKLATTKR